MKIEIKFDINDKVKITPLNCKGIIQSIWITEKGIKYEVRYFDKAEAKNIYFYAEELERIK